MQHEYNECNDFQPLSLSGTKFAKYHDCKTQSLFVSHFKLAYFIQEFRPIFFNVPYTYFNPRSRSDAAVILLGALFITSTCDLEKNHPSNEKLVKLMKLKLITPQDLAPFSFIK